PGLMGRAILSATHRWCKTPRSYAKPFEARDATSRRSLEEFAENVEDDSRGRIRRAAPNDVPSAPGRDAPHAASRDRDGAGILVRRPELRVRRHHPPPPREQGEGVPSRSAREARAGQDTRGSSEGDGVAGSAASVVRRGRWAERPGSRWHVRGDPDPRGRQLCAALLHPVARWCAAHDEGDGETADGDALEGSGDRAEG